MLHFIDWPALTGGLLIGASAVFLMATLGRIAGISGVLTEALKPGSDWWRYAFLLGLPLGALIALATMGIGGTERTGFPLPVLALSGLLVGLGTRIGSGCTSGHGVCGLGRLSKRGLVATLTFMATGIITVWVTRHLLGVL